MLSSWNKDIIIIIIIIVKIALYSQTIPFIIDLI